jgi:precorrin isomerase
MAAVGVRLAVVCEAGVDEEELADLVAHLRRRVLELDVEDVRPAPGDTGAPEGAKSCALVAVAALVVGLAPTVLRSVVHLVETWMRNRPVRTVKVDVGGRVLELGRASAEQQQRLVEAFLAEVQAAAPHGAPAPGGTEPSAPSE